MNTIQTIGVIMVLVSLLGIVLLSMPLGRWLKQLGEARRHRAHQPFPSQGAGSFFDDAPRNELDQLGAEETPSTVADPEAAVAEETAASEPSAAPPAGRPAAPRSRRRRPSDSRSP